MEIVIKNSPETSYQSVSRLPDIQKFSFFSDPHLAIFNALFRRGFWVIPKIIGNLSKPLHKVVIFSLSSKPEDVGQERGKLQKFEYLKNKQSTLSEIKSIFHKLLGLSFDKIWKIEKVSFKKIETFNSWK